MKALATLLFLIVGTFAATAQFNGCPKGFCTKAVSGGGGGSYVGPKDAQTKSAYAWYSCARGYSTAYATAGGNACEICNPGDATCTTVAVGANGKVTIPLIGGVNCATSTCTVRTFYDQSGANNCGGAACNIVQAVEGNRHQLAMNALNSLACISPVAGASNASVASFSNVAQPFTMSFVSRNTATTANAVMGDSGNVGSTTGGANWGFYASSVFSDGASDTTSYHSFNMTAASTPRIMVDSTTTTGGANAAGTSAWTSQMKIGQDAYSRHAGTFCEVGLWAGFSTADDTSMTANQHGTNGYAF